MTTPCFHSRPHWCNFFFLKQFSSSSMIYLVHSNAKSACGAGHAKEPTEREDGSREIKIKTRTPAPWWRRTSRGGCAAAPAQGEAEWCLCCGRREREDPGRRGLPAVRVHSLEPGYKHRERERKAGNTEGNMEEGGGVLLPVLPQRSKAKKTSRGWTIATPELTCAWDGEAQRLNVRSGPSGVLPPSFISDGSS